MAKKLKKRKVSHPGDLANILLAFETRLSEAGGAAAQLLLPVSNNFIYIIFYYYEGFCPFNPDDLPK
ncbi:MAG: hypothetical protein M3O71_09665 [Bacteroidota bacterium]|nr:hypothetical protein [Bacteroidota bacterium]